MAENCKECLYYTLHYNILRGHCTGQEFNPHQYDNNCPGFVDKSSTYEKLNEFIEDVNSMIGSPHPPRKIYKIGDKATISKDSITGIIEEVRHGLYWDEYKLCNVEGWYNSDELIPILCEGQMWIARDRDDALWLFSDEPELEGNFHWKLEYDGKNTCNQLTSSMFPEVTFENSPKKITFSIW